MTTKRTTKRPRRSVKISDGRLQARLDARKHDSLLLGEVDTYIQSLPNDRVQTVIHPSEMARDDWCPRATWHRLSGRTAKPEPLVLRSALIFDTGSEIHRKWQRWFQGMGILWGHWYCLICEESMFSWSNELPIAGCPYGKRTTHQWEYREVPLRDDPNRIAGHADGIVNPSYAEPVLIEVKSVGPGTLRNLSVMSDREDDDLSSDRFSKITRPARSHFLQAQIYMRLSENWVSELGEVRRACIIYEHKADQQVREFVITKDYRWTDPLFEDAQYIVWAISRDREVPCPHGGCARCRAYEEAR